MGEDLRSIGGIAETLNEVRFALDQVFCVAFTFLWRCFELRKDGKGRRRQH